MWHFSAPKNGSRKPIRRVHNRSQPRLEALEDRCLLSNVPPAGITDWWTGDGSADDLIGRQNGTLVGGAATGPGLVDQAFVLNGQGSFVNVPDNAALDVGTGNFTLSLWAKFNSTSGEQVLAEKYIETFGNTATGWTLTKLSTNVLRLALTDGTDAPVDVDSKALSIPTNTWVHFAVRRSGSSITTFMNGNAVASGTCSYNLNSTASLKLGHRGNPSDTPGSTDTRNFYLNGNLDEAQFYVGTALTNTQIQGIYHDGAAGESKPMAVSRVSPAADSIVVGTPPTDFAVHFSEAYNPSTLQAGDFTVNGVAADSITLTDANDATFHYNSSPVTAQGLQTMQMAAGSVTAADTTLPASYQSLEAWTKSFRYDAVVMQVSSSSPAANGFISIPNPTLQVNFNEPYDPNTVSTSNLTLSQGTVTGFTMSSDHTSVTYTLAGLSEGTVNVSIPAGALTDAYGNPMQGYSATYGVDIGTMPFSAPLVPQNPAGSLVFQGNTTGLINGSGDTDTFTLAIDPGQTITVLVSPTSSSLQPTVQLLDSSNTVLGTATAASPGQTALLQTVPAAAGGTYSIVVGGANATAGSYNVQVTLNAQLDTGNDGSTPVQSLDGGAIDVEPGPVTIDRAAALGTVDRPVARITTATAGVTNDLRGSWDQVGASTTWNINNGSGVTGSLSRTAPSNAYSFYGRVGDVVTLRTSGSSSGGGTLSAAYLTLQDPNGVQTAGTQVSGASSDYTISNFTLTTTGTYTVTVSTSSHGKGTYTLTANLITPANPRPNAADIYSISATAGQYLSFGVATGDSLVGQSQVQLALYAPGVDPITGTPVATSSSRGTLDGLLEYDPVSTGSYEVKVTAGPSLTGNSVNYSLVAVNNGSFEANGGDGSFAAAQDITGRPGVLGAQTTNTTTFISAGSGGLSRSIGITFGPDGNFYVSSWNNNEVMRYNGSTGAPDPIAGQSGAVFVTSKLGGLQSPEYLRFGPDGNLYVVSSPTNEVFRYNGSTGAADPASGQTGAVFVSASNNGGLSDPLGLTFDASGNLYVGGGNSNNIIRYDQNGNPTVFVPTSANGGLSRPEGLTFGPDGNLYVSSSTGTNPVLRYDGKTGAFLGVFVASGSGGLSFPTGLAFGPDGNLYVSSVPNNQVLMFQGPAGAQPGAFLGAYIPSGGGGLNRPTDLVFDANGYLYVSTADQSTVLRAGVTSDFYQVTLAAGQTVTFSTSTPGDGAGQPANFLDPHIELYDPTQTLVATGTVLSDGRNESITYTAPAAGTYYLKVSRQNFTEGDYVLDPISTAAAPAVSLGGSSSLSLLSQAKPLISSSAPSDGSDSSPLMASTLANFPAQPAAPSAAAIASAGTPSNGSGWSAFQASTLGILEHDLSQWQDALMQELGVWIQIVDQLVADWGSAPFDPLGPIQPR